MVELLRIGDEKNTNAYPVYHIDNPVGQPWKDMTPVLAAALGIPARRIVSFEEWIKCVRRSPLSTDTENPAARLIDFLEFHFEQHSETMALEGPVSADVVRSYVAKWKEMGFLYLE
ncbi:hypothetical protein NUW58_g10060 [Xylaria curta]|uniref:Uncharacterized protein n=1 Tax=Xylaria curta TaxID=42375 RepID=A0ACC1MS06_9PEZI|nr:hypothetical protein NUW58_g10060 [Xylaria curta]